MSSQDTVEVLPWYQWMFMAVLVLGVAMAVALIVRTVLLATGYGSDGNSDPLCSTLSFMVLLCYIGLHLLGYYCQYVKTPLTRWYQWMVITGSLAIVSACFSVLTIYTNYTSNIAKTAYIVLASAVMQCLSYIGFLVCAVNTQCFGCINIHRIAFYVMAALSAIGFLVYIFIFQWYYDSAVQDWWSGDGNHRNKISLFKTTVPTNLVCSIMLCVGAYQVNMCCIPWSRWDVLLLVLLGSALGILIVIVISGHGSLSGGNDPASYILLFLATIATIVLLVIIHFKEPLSQYWSKDRLACGVLSLVSLVTWIGVMSFYGNDERTPLYCLVVYGCITFGGALYYGFRSGLVKVGCFTKKSTGSSSTQLQGSEEAVSSTEVTVESTSDTVEVTRDTE